MRTRYFATVPLKQVATLSSTDATGDTAQHARGRTSIRTNRRRVVLVVDDERVIADTLVAILNESGFTAHAAYSGDLALERMCADVPDLVITDVSMPGMNGIELAINVREKFPGCKVLLFSGHAATTGLMEEARQRGYDFELLSKPVHPRDLLDRIQRCA